MNALNITEYTQTLGVQAKVASAHMAKAQAATKNRALRQLATLLRENTAALQIDNAKDIERAQAAGVTEAYFDRGGFLFHGRVKAVAEAARDAGLKI